MQSLSEMLSEGNVVENYFFIKLQIQMMISFSSKSCQGGDNITKLDIFILIDQIADLQASFYQQNWKLYHFLTSRHRVVLLVLIMTMISG